MPQTGVLGRVLGFGRHPEVFVLRPSRLQWPGLCANCCAPATETVWLHRWLPANQLPDVPYCAPCKGELEWTWSRRRPYALAQFVTALVMLVGMLAALELFAAPRSVQICGLIALAGIASMAAIEILSYATLWRQALADPGYERTIAVRQGLDDLFGLRVSLRLRNPRFAAAVRANAESLA